MRVTQSTDDDHTDLRQTLTCPVACPDRRGHDWYLTDTPGQPDVAPDLQCSGRERVAHRFPSW
jgi:hypothetical protein